MDDAISSNHASAIEAEWNCCHGRVSGPNAGHAPTCTWAASLAQVQSMRDVLEPCREEFRTPDGKCSVCGGEWDQFHQQRRGRALGATAGELLTRDSKDELRESTERLSKALMGGTISSDEPSGLFVDEAGAYGWARPIRPGNTLHGPDGERILTELEAAKPKRSIGWQVTTTRGQVTVTAEWIEEAQRNGEMIAALFAGLASRDYDTASKPLKQNVVEFALSVIDALRAGNSQAVEMLDAQIELTKAAEAKVARYERPRVSDAPPFHSDFTVAKAAEL